MRPGVHGQDQDQTIKCIRFPTTYNATAHVSEQNGWADMGLPHTMDNKSAVGCRSVTQESDTQTCPTGSEVELAQHLFNWGPGSYAWKMVCGETGNNMVTPDT